MLFLLVVFFAGFSAFTEAFSLTKSIAFWFSEVCSDLRLCNEVLDLRDFHIVLLCEFLVLFLNSLIGETSRFSSSSNLLKCESKLKLTSRTAGLN